MARHHGPIKATRAPVEAGEPMGRRGKGKKKSRSEHYQRGPGSKEIGGHLIRAFQSPIYTNRIPNECKCHWVPYGYAVSGPEVVTWVRKFWYPLCPVRGEGHRG